MSRAEGKGRAGVGTAATTSGHVASAVTSPWRGCDADIPAWLRSAAEQEGGDCGACSD